MSVKRRVRPGLERTKPIRSWTTAVSVGSEPRGDRVGDNVRTANHVLEEYLSAGRATAQRFGGSGRPSGNGPDISQGMMRAVSDSVTMWLEFMARTMGAATSPSTPPPSPLAETAPAPPQKPGLRLAVEVDSIRPTTVSVDVRPDVRGSDLYVDRLHARARTGRPLTGIEIDAVDGEIPRIRLRVDPKIPAGVYDGVIVNKVSSLPAGTISVVIQQNRSSRQKGVA